MLAEQKDKIQISTRELFWIVLSSCKCFLPKFEWKCEKNWPINNKKYANDACYAMNSWLDSKTKHKIQPQFSSKGSYCYWDKWITVIIIQPNIEIIQPNNQTTNQPSTQLYLQSQNLSLICPLHSVSWHYSHYSGNSLTQAERKNIKNK